MNYYISFCYAGSYDICLWIVDTSFSLKLLLVSFLILVGVVELLLDPNVANGIGLVFCFMLFPFVIKMASNN